MTAREIPGMAFWHAGKRATLAVALGAWAAAVGLVPTLEAKLLTLAPAPAGALAWWTIVRPERWLGLFFFCALLLPPMPFPFGNAGIHVAPLATLLGLLAGVLRVKGWRIRELEGNKVFASLLVLFSLILLLSVAFAVVFSGWEIALASLVRVFLFCIAVYVLFYVWIGPRDERSDSFAFARMLFWFGLAGAAFACVDFYFQFPAPAGYGAQFVWLEKTVVRRAQGVFYESSTLGNFCAFFLVMVLVATFTPNGTRERRILSRPVLFGGGLIFGAALMLSASRGSIVTVIVASLVFLCLRRTAARRAAIAIGVSLAVAAGGVRLALPEFSAHYWTRTLSFIQNFRTDPDNLLSGRLTHWGALADFIVQHPWHMIFGIGYKTLPYTDYLGAPIVADNTYLSLLVETGLVGLAIFVLLNTAILRAGWRAARSRSARTSFFGLWIFCFWCGELVQMLSGDLITYWRVLPVYFWVLAAALRDSSGAGRAALD